MAQSCCLMNCSWLSPWLIDRTQTLYFYRSDSQGHLLVIKKWRCCHQRRFFTALGYASTLYVVVLCPSVRLSVCPSICLSHAGLELYQNG